MRTSVDLLTNWRTYFVNSCVLLSALGAVCIVSGCDNGMATVTGTVSMDGAPVAAVNEVKGTVTFFREDGSGVPLVGLLEDEGFYEAKAGAGTQIQPGNYLVAIAVNKVERPADPNALAIPKLLSPQKYKNVGTSGLRAEIKPGKNTIDFDLRSEAGK